MADGEVDVDVDVDSRITCCESTLDCVEKRSQEIPPHDEAAARRELSDHKIHFLKVMVKSWIFRSVLIFVLAALLSSTMSKLVATDRQRLTALLVIDIQKCFTSGGTLAVSEADSIIPVVNRLRDDIPFDVVIATLDWHCQNHVSFASQHPGCRVHDTINLTYLETGELCQRDGACLVHQAANVTNCSRSSSRTVLVTQHLWPDHCVMDTDDAKFNPQLNVKPSDIIVHKGTQCQIDSYSGFYDNGHVTSTNLHSVLSDRKVTTVYIVGIATDYCVYYTAKDAFNLGYETYVVLDATRWVAASSREIAISDMKHLGIKLINSAQVASTMLPTSSASLRSSPMVATAATIVLTIMRAFYTGWA